MNVLLIPEDFRKDQYILKPLFTRLFRHLGATSTRIAVCLDPLLGGVDAALKPESMDSVIARHPMIDVFILCVDRDGEAGRRLRLNRLEGHVSAQHGVRFFAENAWQELETWVLAGLRLPNDWPWRDVRTEVHPKEQYFEPLARERGLSDELGGGRKALAEEAARRIRTILLKCPEDFDALAKRLSTTI